jgi:hypothetical protein
MITIQLTLLLILAGLLHIIRDKIEVNYDATVFARLPKKLQIWFDPRISWKNKKSDNAIWQIIISVILVDFTDFKHFLKFLEINTFIFIFYYNNIIGLREWIFVYLIRGAGVFIGNLNWFGKELINGNR